MKVLHLIASVDPACGGPIEGLLRIAQSDRDLGVAREIASLDPEDAPWLAHCPLVVHALGGPPADPGRSWTSTQALRRYRFSPRYVRWLNANHQRYDALVVEGLWNFTTAGFATSRALHARPYVAFAHGMLDPWFRRTYPIKHLAKQAVWLMSDGRVLGRAGRVLFTSALEQAAAEGAFWPYRLRGQVVSYGTAAPPPPTTAQTAAFHSAAPSLSARLYLLCLGRLHEKKGIDLLISAFAAVAPQDLHLVVAGSGSPAYTASLEAQAAALGIAPRIHFTGPLFGDAKWGAFRGAEAFVLPSHQENLGIAVLEAMACGLPVLISDKVNIWPEIQAAGCGLVDEDTVDGTSRMLTRLLERDPAARRAMGEAGRLLFADRFGAVRAARDLDTVLREVVAAGPSR
jgi:glycosyltransferase involved in cell wall biosynthesis